MGLSVQAATAFFEFAEGQARYRSFGPIAGPGTIVEFGFLAGFILSGEWNLAFALSGSASATVENLVAGTPFVGQSDLRQDGVPALRVRLADGGAVAVVLPLLIRVAPGAHFVVLGTSSFVPGTGRMSLLCWVKLESPVREPAGRSGTVLEDLRRGATEARSAAPSA